MNGQYAINSTWSADGLSPAAIAARTLAMLDELTVVAPSPCEWQFVDQSVDFPMPDDADFDEDRLDELEGQLGVSMGQFRANAANLVARWIAEDEQDDPVPPSGYTLLISDQRAYDEGRLSQDVHIRLNAGSTYSNSIALDWGAFGVATDPSIISYDRCRRTLEAMASSWPCPWAAVYFSEFSKAPPNPVFTHEDVLRVLQEPDDRYPPLLQWIVYLSAPLAKGLAASSALITEFTAGGGVVLSVTKDRFDPANPEHLRGATILGGILDRRLSATQKNDRHPAPRAGSL